LFFKKTDLLVFKNWKNENQQKVVVFRLNSRHPLIGCNVGWIKKCLYLCGDCEAARWKKIGKPLIAGLPDGLKKEN
jgi:hypothetical protein